jgi:hypothetical protein
MRKIKALAIALALFSMAAASSQAAAVHHVRAPGCYRLGLSGYRWYRSCVGPSFLYPHHRVCHRGYCRYY